MGQYGPACGQRQAPLELAALELAGPAGPSPPQSQLQQHWAVAALVSTALALMAPVSALVAPTAAVLLKMPKLHLSQAAFVGRRTWQVALVVVAPWPLSPWHDSWSPLQPWRQGHITDSHRSAFALVACLATG